MQRNSKPTENKVDDPNLDALGMLCAQGELDPHPTKQTPQSKSALEAKSFFSYSLTNKLDQLAKEKGERFHTEVQKPYHDFKEFMSQNDKDHVRMVLTRYYEQNPGKQKQLDRFDKMVDLYSDEHDYMRRIIAACDKLPNVSRSDIIKSGNLLELISRNKEILSQKDIIHLLAEHMIREMELPPNSSQIPDIMDRYIDIIKLTDDIIRSKDTVVKRSQPTR